jgi:D-alanine-D-alanine ligase
MRIGFVYDARDDYLAEGYDPVDLAEFDAAVTIDGIADALTRQGAQVDRIGRGQALARRLAAGERWDLVFSIAEGLKGRSREAQVPALCEMFDQAYAFSDPLTMAVTLDKAMAKRLVRDQGVPTAPFMVLDRAELATAADLPFPLFVKPLAEGTGKGCAAASVVQNRAELAKTTAALTRRFAQPVIAETYLPGREFTVAILGNGAAARVIGVLEIRIRPELADQVYSYDNKENSEERVTYHLAHDAEAQLAGQSALAAYRALECRDAARIDMRSNADHVPQFLEVNPIAGLNPVHSDLPMIAEMAGHDFDWLIGQILDAACARLGLTQARALEAAE